MYVLIAAPAGRDPEAVGVQPCQSVMHVPFGITEETDAMKFVGMWAWDPAMSTSEPVDAQRGRCSRGPP